MTLLQNEWANLHRDIEKYERHSLAIKLIAVLASLLSMAYGIDVIFSVLLVFILWLQDAIWKTFQARLETRIIFIEQNLQKEDTNNNQAFQLYSQWQNKRQGIAGLIKEYLFSAAKPTVAYPYALLAILIFVFHQ